jgi:hypothetical protein
MQIRITMMGTNMEKKRDLAAASGPQETILNKMVIVNMKKIQTLHPSSSSVEMTGLSSCWSSQSLLSI